MKYIRLFTFGMLAILASSCSNTPFNSNMGYRANQDLAVLTGYQLSDGFVTIQTIGYGCTFFDSFKVVAHHGKPNSLAIQRIKPDECNMSPHIVSLQYSFKHLAVDLSEQIQIVNPMGKPEELASLQKESRTRSL